MRRVINKIYTLSTHLIKALFKFKILVILGGGLVLSVILIPWKFGVTMENPGFAVYSGGVASILATMVWKIFEELQLSLDAHTELIRIANDFCEDGREVFSKNKSVEADLVSELYGKIVEIRKLYPILTDKTSYYSLATKMHECYLLAAAGGTKEKFISKIEELEQHIKQIA